MSIKKFNVQWILFKKKRILKITINKRVRSLAGELIIIRAKRLLVCGVILLSMSYKEREIKKKRDVKKATAQLLRFVGSMKILVRPHSPYLSRIIWWPHLWRHPSLNFFSLSPTHHSPLIFLFLSFEYYCS